MPPGPSISLLRFRALSTICDCDMLTRLFVVLTLILGCAVHAEEPAILVLGDSLSAAYGIPVERGWVNLLDQRIRTQGYKYRVVNASISGETSQGGFTRFSGLLERHAPAIVIVELGANDGLRGYPLSILARNLGAMVELATAAGAEFVLVGMQLPVNYGAAYSRAFGQVFTDQGNRGEVSLVPFLLDGFAEELNFFQSDGFHPTAEAQPFMLDNVWEVLVPLLETEPRDQPVISSESG